MMNYLFALCLFFSLAANAGAERSALAMVDDVAITYKDVEHRLRLLALNENIREFAPDALHMMEQNVMQQLINEALIKTEARRLNIVVTKDEIERGLAQVMAAFKVGPDKMEGFLKAHSIPVTALKRQVESDLTWNKVINRMIRPFVDVTERDIFLHLNSYNTPKTKVSIKEARVDFADNAGKQKAYHALEQFRAKVTGCAVFDSQAAKIKPAAALSAQSEFLEALDPATRRTVMTLPLGFPSHIIEGSGLARVLMVCGRDNYQTATRNQAENAVQEQQVMQKAGLYLGKLRKKAFIRFHE